MVINVKKTVVITYSRKTLLQNYSYYINKEEIRRECVVSDLGVLFDSKMLFTQHVNGVTSRARRNLGLILWISRHFRNSATVIRRYKAMVRPLLEYCPVAWNYNRECTRSKLESVQKKLFWHLGRRFGIPLNSYEDYCSYFRLESLETRRALQELIYMYRCVHGHYEGQISKIGFRVPYCSTRAHRLLLYMGCGQLAPMARCVALTNSLDIDVFCTDFEEFKKEGKRALLP